MDEDIDLEAEAEQFMLKQAELESGDTSVPELEQAVGVDTVPDEVAKKYCKDILQTIRDLETFREMTFEEIKLIIAIDPRNREQAPAGSEQQESDVTRAEMANSLSEIINGKLPNDRIALKVLWEEMMTWPALDIDRQKLNENNQDDEKKAGWREGQARPPVGRDQSETPVNLEDMLPEWVGYSYLYLLSAVPLMIAVVVVAILFVNSLQ
eukprot:g2499.t2